MNEQETYHMPNTRWTTLSDLAMVVLSCCEGGVKTETEGAGMWLDTTPPHPR